VRLYIEGILGLTPGKQREERGLDQINADERQHPSRDKLGASRIAERSEHRPELRVVRRKIALDENRDRGDDEPDPQGLQQHPDDHQSEQHSRLPPLRSGEYGANLTHGRQALHASRASFLEEPRLGVVDQPEEFAGLRALRLPGSLETVDKERDQ
jgi:hypothetical protein